MMDDDERKERKEAHSLSQIMELIDTKSFQITTPPTTQPKTESQHITKKHNQIST
jgi:predicted transcriptional regulator